MANVLPKDVREMERVELEDLKDTFSPKHGMTGFDTTEDDLLPGYFRSSFFIGTISVHPQQKNCSIAIANP